MMAPGKAEALAGQPALPSTTSLDLPSGLARILAMDTFHPAAPMVQPAGLMSTVSPAALAQTERTPMVPQFKQGGMVGRDGYPQLPSYQQGGEVGPGGAPVGLPPGVAAAQQSPQVQAWQAEPMDPSQMHGTITQQLAQNPNAGEQIRRAIMSAMQSGELTAQELNMAIQLIEAAVNNPGLYPQLRQYAVQQGIATEEDLPPQYDKGFIMMLLTVAKSAQQLVQGGANVMPMQSMKGGGGVRGPSNAPVPIMAHEGEYVVPKNVVEMKGREFFDNLVKKYSEQA